MGGGVRWGKGGGSTPSSPGSRRPAPPLPPLLADTSLCSVTADGWKRGWRRGGGQEHVVLFQQLPGPRQVAGLQHPHPCIPLQIHPSLDHSQWSGVNL